MLPTALILRTAGTNCDRETAYAFEQAGAKTVSLHINRLLENPDLLHDYQLLAIPGGFSYGDDINSGRIFANQISQHLAPMFHRFVEAGKPIIGICNGFQVLVKTDLLPGPLAGRTGQTATLAHNDSHRFIDRWVHLAPRSKHCIWTRNLPATLELPIAHGEGKFIPASESVRRALWDQDQIALIYTRPDGTAANGEPANPNGSTDDIAGVCDSTGLIFGLMPHPERHVSPLQHPAWTSHKPLPPFGVGILFFNNAIHHVQSGVGAGI
ncbi:MAG TPA: phosphoribosylformylglycinamidine synthase I [Tepidisphaeraceae bacterium]|jgi:phosphoribosylformylglycinamidine synthase|nr:phosphoribosylformylglycinamidine synthase I [Tepidisphaeraceae bacterium]